MPIINWAREKKLFTIKGLPKMLFFYFCFFVFFSFFQILNEYCQKSHGKTILYNEFRGFQWSSTTSQIFLSLVLATAISSIAQFRRQCYVLWELLKVYRPTFIASVAFDFHRQQKVLIFIAQPHELSFM